MPKTLDPVQSDSRKVGDTIQVYDNMGGNYKPVWTGNITQITKKYVMVRNGMNDTRFHRATGYVVGYNWPHYTVAVPPETS